jgi:hypothetical protein
MTRARAVEYHRNVPAPRSGARQWIAAGALLLSAVCFRPGSAGAATTSFDVSGQPVVQVIGRTAAVTIRTWNRDSVQVDYPDGDLTLNKGTQQTRASFLIPAVNVEEDHGAEGPTIATLQPEDFPVPKLESGMHDVVHIAEVSQAAGPRPPAHVTVMVPEGTGLVNIRAGRGTVRLIGYRGTTIAFVGRGRLSFEGVSGDAFVQLPLLGHFYATDSTFDRLRIRSNRADLVFDGCRARQIEATTLTGNIVYDNGAFDPGLARFESDRGSIALGVSGGAQLHAHTEDGHVFTELPTASAPPLLGARDDAEPQQIAGGGGPLVNVNSTHGDVILYDGSLADRRPASLAPAWHSMYDLLLTTRDQARRAPGEFQGQPLQRTPANGRPPGQRSMAGMHPRRRPPQPRAPDSQ